MNTYYAISGVFTLAILLGYINFRFIRMQSSIAITMSALGLSVFFIFAAHMGFGDVEKNIVETLNAINFHSLLMNGMLSFLLFAGALNVHLDSLEGEKWEVMVLAFVGTIVSTFIIGGLSFYLLQALNQSVSFIYCLLFGAVISPTDPIAVLAIFKKIGAPKSLDARLAGESLFNDGIAVVIFITIYSIAFEGHGASIPQVLGLFAQQAFGGIAYGAALGILGFWLIKPIDNSQQEIFITLGIATGGYAFAQAIDISGPLAMVVAGIIIGNHTRAFHMSAKAQEHLDHFWEVIDNGLNAMLFILVGLELNLIKVSMFEFVTGLAAITIVLFARIIAVGGPLTIMGLKRQYEPYSKSIMIWGGLRGGLAIALALAIPNSPERQIILPMVYAVVLFSILVQGLTVNKLVKKCLERMHAEKKCLY